MGQDQFNAVFPIIIADLVKMIAGQRNITEDEAIQLLYTTELYAQLEQEDTKLWRYSTPMLYSLLEQELDYGMIRYPDV